MTTNIGLFPKVSLKEGAKALCRWLFSCCPRAKKPLQAGFEIWKHPVLAAAVAITTRYIHETKSLRSAAPLVYSAHCSKSLQKCEKATGSCWS